MDSIVGVYVLQLGIRSCMPVYSMHTATPASKPRPQHTVNPNDGLVEWDHVDEASASPTHLSRLHAGCQGAGCQGADVMSGTTCLQSEVTSSIERKQFVGQPWPLVLQGCVQHRFRSFQTTRLGTKRMHLCVFLPRRRPCSAAIVDSDGRPACGTSLLLYWGRPMRNLAWLQRPLLDGRSHSPGTDVGVLS
ncbi:unnamed protein product [Protopolystoma xenopodis]|uniref:Uncharacterized protein n=1 Tax=Protopolystoma xenopodis TaxID=117903 RepID=A0A448WSH0_9PLAT|nr:unnamed protein product [Protopolystoma xenopodis]